MWREYTKRELIQNISVFVVIVRLGGNIKGNFLLNVTGFVGMIEGDLEKNFTEYICV
jgi:hypothetical protein